MTWNFKNELARKTVHLLAVFILLVYFIASEMFNTQIALIILVLVLIFFLELEYLRLEIAKDIPFLRWFWKYVKRRKEKNRIGGDVFFLIGAILVLAVFDVRIAIASILMLIFGDMAAALIGKRFGKNYFMKKRAWEGVFAEFFVDVVIGILVFFWLSWNFSNWPLWIIIFVMALTATVVETFIYKMDDNLLIPVFSGFNGQIVLLILKALKLL